MAGYVRFVTILFVALMVGAPGAIALENYIAKFYPTMTLMPFVLLMVGIGFIFAFSLRFNWVMASIIAGFLLESFACLLLLTQMHSGTVAPWVGGVLWLATAMGITMSIDESYQRMRKLLH